MASVDHNKHKWSGFFPNEEAAQEHLEEQTLKLAGSTKLVVSASKEFVNKRSHDLLLYKFSVCTIEK